jgi:hypothetical protein
MADGAPAGFHDDRHRAEVLEQLLDRYEDLSAQGQPIMVSELCRDCPELSDEVRHRIDALRRVDALLDWADAADEPVPKQLGRYRLDQFLGAGGFGQVWRGYDPELQRPVAIKIPCGRRVGSPTGREVFLKEARKIAKLKHPHIVPVHDVGQVGRWDFIVSDWIDGKSLAQQIAEGRPSFEESAKIVVDVADALHYAHRRNIVHRDVKPANILLDKQGKAYLTDFGIAASEEELLCQNGLVSGTLPYMAPEQLEGKNVRVTPRTDIYSLGVVLYELLTGRRPFQVERKDVLREQILSGVPWSPRAIDGKVPEPLESICLKAIFKEPEGRYATARDMAKALRRWQSRRHWPTRRKVLALGALGVLLVLAVVLALLLHPDPPPPLLADMRVIIWNADPARKRMLLSDPQALPLRAKDQIRIEVELNRPAYVYLLWIGAEGAITPLYPWVPGEWDKRPREVRTNQVNLPEAVDQGWSMEGASGMESLLLLARDEPLPADVDLKQMLLGLPKLPLQDPRTLVWFTNGVVTPKSAAPLRGPDVFTPRPLDDPVLKLQGEIQQRLAPHIKVSRAVSFAFQGE